jgi:hypothetical protein
LAIIAILFTAFALQLSGSAWAGPPGLVISTGRDGGGYFYIGERLKSAMLLEHGSLFEVVTSFGSLENLERLQDPSSPVGVTLTQADALAWHLQQYPEFAQEFIVLGDVGKECVFLIARRGGELRTAADLKGSAGVQISVDDPTSGAAVTFSYLKQLEPRFGSTRVVFTDSMETLLQLKVAAQHSPTKAAMIVQRPKANSAPIRTYFENPEIYEIVSISEADVGNARLPDGSVIYSFERVVVGGKKRQRPISVETMCTRGIMLASKVKLDKELRGQLSALMLKSADLIIGEDE